MAQRTVALCDGKYIGIEMIYTVINGKQINIPEKLQELRLKSKKNELFCPCGCGANLILVAGDKKLREQHFRLKHGSGNQDCHVVVEGKTSIDAKIVLKCWLDDKLQVPNIDTRVPIHAVDDNNRKYEFTFLSRDKKLALNYWHKRTNISDEKIEILENNSKDIYILYVVDGSNGGSEGQYPEGLMKIQDRQGYCLLLDVISSDYSKAVIKTVFYAKDCDGLWTEIIFVKGALREFSFGDNGKLTYKGEALECLKDRAIASFMQKLQEEKQRRIEEEKKRIENEKKILEEERKRKEYKRLQEEEYEKKLQQQKEEADRRKTELEEQRRIEIERQQKEKRQREEDFMKNMDANFSQQKTQVRDAEGRRWIECEFCGKRALEDVFSSYGGREHINLGTCKECDRRKRLKLLE